MAEQPPPVPEPAPSPELPKGMAIAAMVLGIVGLIFCIPYISVPCAIVGIILGVIARNKAKAGTGGGQGMATAGLLCGVAGILLVVVFLVGALAFIGFAGKKAVDEAGGLEGLQRQMKEEMERQSRQGDPTSMLQPLEGCVGTWLT